MVAIQTNMGLLPQFFFPEGAGRDYVPSPYLQLLGDLRRNVTVFSGLSHPGMSGGHAADQSFLTAALEPGRETFHNSISLDQFAAERLGSPTQFRSLSLSCCNGGDRSLSYDRNGRMIPADPNPANFYRRLFLSGDRRPAAAREHDLEVGRSLLDAVAEDARRLQRAVGKDDRNRLDDYFTSIRETECRLQRGSTASHDFVERLRQTYAILQLALTTDAARIITLFIQPLGTLSTIAGVSRDTHVLTHHAEHRDAVDELRKIEEAQLLAFRDLLTSLRDTTEHGASLLDRTMVLYGSALGDANSHSVANLPILLAGGGFRHGRHRVFDTRPHRNEPLSNLFVSMLRRLGLAVDRFGSSTGPLGGLETA